MAWKMYNLQGCLRGTCVWALGQPKQQLGCGVSRWGGLCGEKLSLLLARCCRVVRQEKGVGRLEVALDSKQLISHSSSHSKALGMLKSHISHMMPSILSRSTKDT